MICGFGIWECVTLQYCTCYFVTKDINPDSMSLLSQEYSIVLVLQNDEPAIVINSS